MKILLPILLIFCTISAYSQINDGFTDGNFTVNPSWFGDTSKLDINASFELWHNAPPVTSNSFFYINSTYMGNTTWEFLCRMDFNPSSVNFTRFYLNANQTNINSPFLNSYYIELGRVNDEISLYKTVNGTSTKIIDGIDNQLNSATCNVRVKLIQVGPNFDLQVDTTGGTSFVSLGTCIDNSISNALFSGFYAKYTSTRSDRFFYDDIHISGSQVLDNTVPEIISWSLNQTFLNLCFSEPIIPASLNLSNFNMSPGLSVIGAVYDSLNINCIHLELSDTILNDTLYLLEIGSIEDYSGNDTSNVVFSFINHPIQEHEISINEIMCDPSPSVNLPTVEYIELKNNTNIPLQLEGLILRIGSTNKILPNYYFPPNSYITIADANDTNLLYQHRPLIGINSFPALSNSGTTIQILDTSLTIIDEVKYNLSWYRDASKDDGGYSLERINPEEFCVTKYNWKASTSINGGTPSIENSVYDTSNIPFEFTYSWIDSLNILIVFNQHLDTATLTAAGINAYLLQQVTPISLDSCILTLSSFWGYNTPYVISFNALVKDCSNQSVNDDYYVQAVYYKPKEFDILIHEILVDETPVVALPEAEYIELRNNLPFDISLLNFKLKINSDEYILGNYTLPADSFIVFVDDDKLNLFPTGIAAPIANMSSITNEYGTIELFAPNGYKIHYMEYDIDYLDITAKKNGGWSLEMIDHTNECVRNKNWSASNSVFGGTPGRRNSFTQTSIDSISPILYHVGVDNATSFSMYFTESMLDTNLNFAIIPLQSDSIYNIHFSSELNSKISFKTRDSLFADSTFRFLIQNLYDCEGNILTIDTISYKQPSLAENFDVVINEVLFNPTENCVDYIELYNRSNNVIDLKEIQIGVADTNVQLLISPITISEKSVLLFPNEHIYFSKNPDLISECYQASNRNYWQLRELMDMNNTNDIIGIANSISAIDVLAYNEDWHFDLLNSTDGVSLERINPNNATQSSTNWHSASSIIGFGTPGYINSQFIPSQNFENEITIDPTFISPDNDGYQDVISIYYKNSLNGYIANVKIFDTAGRLIKTLVDSETLSSDGIIIWDGITNDGVKASVGIHIVQLELLNVNGEFITIKKSIVVAAKL